VLAMITIDSTATMRMRSLTLYLLLGDRARSSEP